MKFSQIIFYLVITHLLFSRSRFCFFARKKVVVMTGKYQSLAHPSEVVFWGSDMPVHIDLMNTII